MRVSATKVSIAPLEHLDARILLLRIVQPWSVSPELFLRLRTRLARVLHVCLASITGTPRAARLSALLALVVSLLGIPTAAVETPLVITRFSQAASAQPVSQGRTAKLVLLAPRVRTGACRIRTILAPWSLPAFLARTISFNRVQVNQAAAFHALMAGKPWVPPRRTMTLATIAFAHWVPLARSTILELAHLVRLEPTREISPKQLFARCAGRTNINRLQASKAALLAPTTASFLTPRMQICTTSAPDANASPGILALVLVSLTI